MSSLYFVLDVFCLYEARAPEFDMQPLVPNSGGLYCVHCKLNTERQILESSFKLAEYVQYVHEAQNNDDIS